MSNIDQFPPTTIKNHEKYQNYNQESYDMMNNINKPQQSSTQFYKLPIQSKRTAENDQIGSSCFEDQDDSPKKNKPIYFPPSPQAHQKEEKEEQNKQSLQQNQKPLVGSTGNPVLFFNQQKSQSNNSNNHLLFQKSIPPPSLLGGSLPLVSSGHSLSPDLMFGWKPKIVKHSAPIPLYYDYQEFPQPQHPVTNQPYPIIYHGARPADTLILHKKYSKNANCPIGYPFTFPSNSGNVAYSELAKKYGDCPIKQRNGGKLQKDDRSFTGMHKDYQDGKNGLVFDSDFECGNLDMVAMLSEEEYDLYMRVDVNTRGHHQWFYFSVKNQQCRTVRFNIVNFTKKQSLYNQGMRINVISEKSVKFRKQGSWMEPAASQHHFRNGHWRRAGTNIKYKKSKIMQDFIRSGRRVLKNYYCLSFEYQFDYRDDKTYFAYCIPYTFTMLYKSIKNIEQEHQQQYKEADQFIKLGTLCKSLSGIQVPLITITNRINSPDYMLMKKEDYEMQNKGNNNNSSVLSSFSNSNNLSNFPAPWNDKNLYKPSERQIVLKKVIIITGRVHPGESVGSWMMSGFLRYVTGNSLNAQELRRRIVFKVIPMSNPDGVIIGNYRSSICGNDLNRQYQNPDPRLHPTVISIKQLIQQIRKENLDMLPVNTQAQRRFKEEYEPIATFIDMHGHSRKKSAFMYGPYFPLHSLKYLRVRVLPKLMSERTQMFRYWACKFRVQKSKKRAARIVLWKEYGITNCYTLEASFHGYITQGRNRDANGRVPGRQGNQRQVASQTGGGGRKTVELNHSSMEYLGVQVCEVIHEYLMLVEQDDRQKRLRQYQLKMIKKRRLQAKREMVQRKMLAMQKKKKGKNSNNNTTYAGSNNNSSILPSIMGAVSTQDDTDNIKRKIGSIESQDIIDFNKKKSRKQSSEYEKKQQTQTQVQGDLQTIQPKTKQQYRIDNDKQVIQAVINQEDDDDDDDDEDELDLLDEQLDDDQDDEQQQQQQQQQRLRVGEQNQQKKRKSQLPMLSSSFSVVSQQQIDNFDFQDIDSTQRLPNDNIFKDQSNQQEYFNEKKRRGISSHTSFQSFDGQKSKVKNQKVFNRSISMDQRSVHQMMMEGIGNTGKNNIICNNNNNTCNNNNNFKKSDNKNGKISSSKQMKKSMIHSNSKEANVVQDKKKDKYSKQQNKKQEVKKKKNKLNVMMKDNTAIKLPTGAKSQLKTLTLSKNSERGLKSSGNMKTLPSQFEQQAPRRTLNDVFKQVKRGEKIMRDRQQQKIQPFAKKKPKVKDGYSEDNQEDDDTLSQRSLSQDSFGRNSLSSKQQKHKRKNKKQKKNKRPRQSSSDFFDSNESDQSADNLSISQSSYGSDSDPQGDDLNPQQLAQLHGNMIKVIQQFNKGYQQQQQHSKKKKRHTILKQPQTLQTPSSTNNINLKAITTTTVQSLSLATKTSKPPNKRNKTKLQSFPNQLTSRVKTTSDHSNRSAPQQQHQNTKLSNTPHEAYDLVNNKNIMMVLPLSFPLQKQQQGQSKYAPIHNQHTFHSSHLSVLNQLSQQNEKRKSELYNNNNNNNNNNKISSVGGVRISSAATTQSSVGERNMYYFFNSKNMPMNHSNIGISSGVLPDSSNNNNNSNVRMGKVSELDLKNKKHQIFQDNLGQRKMIMQGSDRLSLNNNNNNNFQMTNTNSFKPKLNPKKAKKNKFSIKSGSKPPPDIPIEYSNKDSGGTCSINKISTSNSASRAGTNHSSFNTSKIIRSKHNEPQQSINVQLANAYKRSHMLQNSNMNSFQENQNLTLHRKNRMKLFEQNSSNAVIDRNNYNSNKNTTNNQQQSYKGGSNVAQSPAVSQITPKNNRAIKKRIMATNNNMIQSSNINQIRDFNDLGVNSNNIAPVRKSQFLEHQQQQQEGYYIGPNTRSVSYKKNDLTNMNNKIEQYQQQASKFQEHHNFSPHILDNVTKSPYFYEKSELRISDTESQEGKGNRGGGSSTSTQNRMKHRIMKIPSNSSNTNNNNNRGEFV